jgi:hypothetical protein
MKAADKPAADLGPGEIRKVLEQGNEGTNANARFGALSAAWTGATTRVIYQSIHAR